MKIYRRLPLFARILIGAVLGIGVGLAMGKNAADLHFVSDLVLQVLRLLSTPLIFLSLVHSILKTNIPGRTVGKLLWVLMSNSTIAILIGIFVADTLKPGQHVSNFPPPMAGYSKKPFDSVADLLGKIPKDFVGPFSTNDVIGIILIGIALALALKCFQKSDHAPRINAIVGYVELGLDVTLKMLHWVFEFVPLAVLAVVARLVGTVGIAPLLSMIWFVGAVMLALALMCIVYALRLRLSSWVRPGVFFKSGFDAFALAFSTASSAATLPVTYACATEKIGLKEESASLGIMVGGTFNHDGGALYQAMSALFVAQAIGHQLTLMNQVVLVLMALIASVSTAGIPEGGLVTMLAVFSAVHLPIEYVPLLLPLDWFLDRCRTAINVVGDLASTCIIDGKTRPIPPDDSALADLQPGLGHS